MLLSSRLIIKQFSVKEKLQLGVLFVSTTINGLVQALGIVSVMPLIALLTDPTLADSNQYFLLIKDFLPSQLQDSLLLVLGLISFSLLLIGNAFIVFDYWLTLKFFNVKEFKYAIKLFQQYMNQNYLQFSQKRISDMTRNVIQEVDRVFVGTLLAWVGLLSDLIIAISIIALLLYVNPLITLVASVLIAVMYSLVYWLIIRKIEKLGREFSLHESKVYSAIRQSLEFFREIKVARKSHYFIQRYSKPAKAITRNATRYNILKLVPEQIIEVFAFGLVIFVAIYFSTQVNTSSLVISWVAFFAFAVYRLIPIVKDLFDGIEELKYLDSSLNEVMDEFSSSKIEREQVNNLECAFEKQIECEQLSFTYPGSPHSVLHKFNCTIDADRFTCIVGESGAGKSTLLDLFLGLLQPSQGKILIDGVELTKGHLNAWLEQVGYVPQTIQLYEGTVAENIAFGEHAEKIDQQQVEKVAAIAGIHEFVVSELPLGYQSKIGDSGLNLSGGQKQRIGIARSLYHQPRILLLDEATNELDLNTEKMVLDNLIKTAGLTLVFVTHKPTVFERADSVINLDN